MQFKGKGITSSHFSKAKPLFIKIRQIENWAKENPIKGALLLFPTFELLKFIFDYVTGADYSSLLNSLVTLLNVDFSVKAWHVLLIGGTIIILVVVRTRPRNNKVEGQIPAATENSRTLSSPNVAFAKYPFNASINSQFLKSELGIFSIWGYVADVHNQVHSKGIYMYIIGHATNGGNESNNTSLARYPNAWAIQRIAPTSTNQKGIWRFWCNSTEKKTTHLDYAEVLSGGWHLFSVAWSVENNYIKFILDDKIVAQSEFLNWPTDFSSSIRLGRWASNDQKHFFHSKIGPWRFLSSKYSEDIILDYLKKRPE